MHDDRREVDLTLGQPAEATVEQVPLMEPIDLPLVAPRIDERSVNSGPPPSLIE